MIVVFDGYTDEPAGLGVPPYINTYPRYVFGAAKAALGENEAVRYVTIDDLREKNEKSKLLYSARIVIAISGVHTPGKYVSTMPASIPELLGYFENLGCTKILGGPIASFGTSECGGSVVSKGDMNRLSEAFDFIIPGDIEIFTYNYLSGKNVRDINIHELRNYEMLRKFAVPGAEIVCEHKDFPDFLICEIESYRGCERESFCSFCTEPVRYGRAKFRPLLDIIAEVKALYETGVRHFRIGKQPCIFSYMAQDGVPNPEALEKLFSGISECAPGIKTLHIDNANPHIIAKYPEKCESIAKTLVKYCTSGNVAAFGMESADPDVIRANNLNTNPEEVLSAIRLLNKVGAKRGENGMPKLLPGLNFVFGLMGESRKTFELDFEFLKKVLDEGLLLRRINLRQVAVFPRTRMEQIGDKLVRKHKVLFMHYKYKIRHEIDRVMLERVFPAGTLLTGLRAELQEEGLTFARQTGSYPVLVGVPENIPLNTVFNAKVVGWGFRSITAVPSPLDINKCSRKCLESIPGIGSKRASKIYYGRPVDKSKLSGVIDDPKVLEFVLKLME